MLPRGLVKMTLVVWTTADAHVGTDIKYDRRSLAEAILQSELGGDEGGPAFDWDIMLHLGDLSGAQTSPNDEEGAEVVRQFAASTKHPREDFYNLLGNHDASGPDEPTQWWFKKWVDPTGESTEQSGVHSDRRPYPVTGTWERYSFQAGNVLFLMMGDRNDGGPPVGRGPRGGYPAGAVTLETFEWWVDQVESNQDKIIVSAHHHMLKETTVASGEWEGVDNGYHGRFEDGAPIGASFLYFVGGEPDSGRFEEYLVDHPGAIDVWLGGHTHTNPDDRRGGRSHIETKWGVTFMNVSALARYHAATHGIPMSRVLTFEEGSNTLNVRCYLHTSQHAPQGWHPSVERNVRLQIPFKPFLIEPHPSPDPMEGTPNES